MTLSKTSYLILGMIKLGRRTGYEIKGLVDISARFFWAVSYGQVYPELKRLEGQGLIEGEDDHSDGRRRRAYSLTADGEEALHGWLTSDEPFVNETRHEGVLKFFFADALSPDEQIELIGRLREEHERMVQALTEIEEMARAAHDEDSASHPRLTAQWGLAINRSYVEWLDGQLRSRASRKARA